MRSDVGRSKFLALALVGLGLVVLGFAMPSMARAIRAISPLVLALGGFAVGYAVARLSSQ